MVVPQPTIVASPITPKHLSMTTITEPDRESHPSRRELFEIAHSRICEEIMEEADELFDLPSGARKFIEDGVRGGKGRGSMLQGLSFLEYYATLVDRELSAEETHRACVLGWVVEWVSSCFRVAAGFVDSEYRGRGDLFERAGFGGRGLNEALMLEPVVYRVLRRYFRKDKRYVPLFELVQDASYAAQAGQVVEHLYRAAKGVPPDLSKYTPDALRRVYLHRCSIHEFYFPMAMALVLADENVTQRQLDSAKEICAAIGAIAQAQTDIYEALELRQFSAESGNPVQKGRCTWPLVQALSVCSDADRAVLARTIGKKGVLAAATVRQLYVKLKVHESFSQYWDAEVNRILDMISSADVVLRDGLTAMLSEVVTFFRMPEVSG